jgi:hypothetical protein
MPQSSVSDGVEFECSNGGTLRIIGDDGETDLSRFGSDGEFAYYNDLHIDAHNDMTVDVDGEYHAKGSVQHVTGDAVMWFNLISNEAGGKADFKLTGLQPNAWYRLHFSGVLALCDSGRAHGKTNDLGRLDFTGVIIPDD